HPAAIENCLRKKILIIKDNLVFFKHELYRRTVEEALSPFTRVSLNKKILELFINDFERNKQVERIIHHAKNANEYDLVIRYAPLAAEHAASVGAHAEACRLYFTAIEYYQGQDPETLIRFYESYAYECYLTKQINEAIIYMTKSLHLRKQEKDVESTSSCMRFLSRLWWFNGDHKNAEHFAEQAVEIVDEAPVSIPKAMAACNMFQLKMLLAESAECISWGAIAFELADKLEDRGVLSYALSISGAMQMSDPLSENNGIELLQHSLEIALKDSNQEQVAQAYLFLGSGSVVSRNYSFAERIIDEGLAFCEEKDLDLWTSYILSWKAKLFFEKGNWDEALAIANDLINSEHQASIIKLTAILIVGTIRCRRGEDSGEALLLEAKWAAIATMELRMIIPVISSLLEQEWITGKNILERSECHRLIQMIEQSGNVFETDEFLFWMKRSRNQEISIRKISREDNGTNLQLLESGLQKEDGSSYRQAMILFEGDDDDKRRAVRMVHELGATAVYEKMKLDMRASGIKTIPRGIRRTTRSNPALLTNRELDILHLLNDGLQNKEIASSLFISPKTVDHHISSILFKLDAKSRTKAVQEAVRLEIIK
ncbi:MAG: LuxR C-terminal-related transcriptional regulator, partial [Flavisolibacter sp.]